MAHIFSGLRAKFFDTNGLALSLGKVFTYQAGTSTPLGTFQDKLEGAANTNPIILDANGEADIWLTDAAYKFIVKTSADVTIKTVDNIARNNLASITKDMINWNPSGLAVTLNGSNQLDVQVDNSTVEISSNALRVKDLGVSTAKLVDLSVTSAKLVAVPTSKLDKKIKLRRNSLGYFVPIYPWSGGTVAGRFPATAPARPEVGGWSPDGRFLTVVDSQTSPYVFTYKKGLSSFIKMSDPSTLPTGTGSDAAWSHCAEMFAVAHSTSPAISIYYRNSSGFSKFADPATLPGGNGSAVAWHPSGEYVAVACDGAGDNVVIYRKEGNVFTKITAPVGIAAGGGTAIPTAIHFSPDGSLLAYTQGASPYLHIFSISGATFTKLSNPASLPAGATPSSGQSVRFSNDSSMLAIAHTTTPFITVYSISGSTFTKLSNPATLPEGDGKGVAFHPSGETLAVGHEVGASLTVTLYSIAAGVLTKIADLPNQLTGRVSHLAFSPDGKYFAASNSTGNAMRVWKTDSVLDTEAVLYTGTVLDV